jgi:GNAT superfamily N-acetyltransferase
MIEIDRLREDDWRTLRDIRLRALAEAPYAFWATHADEAAQTESQWRQFLCVAAFHVARRDGQIVGIAAALSHQGAADEPELIAMWVAPHGRRRGVATLLTRRLMAWAADRGATAMTLWVTEGNAAARSLYERIGFTPTGERGAAPHGQGSPMRRMRIQLNQTMDG